jgi:hypothetical protein
MNTKARYSMNALSLIAVAGLFVSCASSPQTGSETEKLRISGRGNGGNGDFAIVTCYESKSAEPVIFTIFEAGYNEFYATLQNVEVDDAEVDPETGIRLECTRRPSLGYDYTCTTEVGNSQIKVFAEASPRKLSRLQATIYVDQSPVMKPLVCDGNGLRKSPRSY